MKNIADNISERPTIDETYVRERKRRNIVRKREEREKEKNEINDKKLLNIKRHFKKNQDGIFFPKKVEKGRKKEK